MRRSDSVKAKTTGKAKCLRPLTKAADGAAYARLIPSAVTADIFSEAGGNDGIGLCVCVGAAFKLQAKGGAASSAVSFSSGAQCIPPCSGQAVQIQSAPAMRVISRRFYPIGDAI